MEYKIAGVKFEITQKRYFFEVKNEEEYKKNQRVIVDTVRGQEIGLVYSESKMMDESKLVLPLKPILRLASKKDEEEYEKLKIEAQKAFTICKGKIFDHNLPMKLITSEFTFDKSKLIFYFTAEGRVDFRKLVKELASIFRIRIELRQIGVRDEARILGDIGVCGQKLCCQKFINNFDSVSIKMAREQGLIINPAKISGACGRLLCCIKYESKQYEDGLKMCPKIGSVVETKEGKGVVTSLNPLNEYIYVKIQKKGIVKVKLEDILKKEISKEKDEIIDKRK
ncbi:MAG: hypothetical protein B6I28_03400 [Fusobacteriia bacterium 4572_132]|nr:MAG: hypothetical protein B6I28_03400 [Fusobacteriia bacterium 4572_132]